VRQGSRAAATATPLRARRRVLIGQTRHSAANTLWTNIAGTQNDQTNLLPPSLSQVSHSGKSVLNLRKIFRVGSEQHESVRFSSKRWLLVGVLVVVLNRPADVPPDQARVDSVIHYGFRGCRNPRRGNRPRPSRGWPSRPSAVQSAAQGSSLRTSRRPPQIAPPFSITSRRSTRKGSLNRKSSRCPVSTVSTMELYSSVALISRAILARRG
jgi:hypothetical protein